jgi:fumarate reductase subunit D
MSDRNNQFEPVRWRLSTARDVPIILVVPLSVLLVAIVFGAFGLAATTVGFILVEALVLYAGYGALTRLLSSTARELLVGT